MEIRIKEVEQKPSFKPFAIEVVFDTEEDVNNLFQELARCNSREITLEQIRKSLLKEAVRMKMEGFYNPDKD